MRPGPVQAPITGTSQAVDPNFTVCRGFSPYARRNARDADRASVDSQGPPGRPSAELDPDELGARLGLTVPHEWWCAPALGKSFEAAGFGWAQVDAPPATILSSAMHRSAHARAVAGLTGQRAASPL
jgi:hypothetical protein